MAIHVHPCAYLRPVWLHVLSDCFQFVLNALFNSKLHFYCTVLASCFTWTSIRYLTGSITSIGYEEAALTLMMLRN